MHHFLRQLITAGLACIPLASYALQPYLAADKVEAADLRSALAAVESKLSAAGFTPVGRHQPMNIEAGTVVVTDPDLMATIHRLGGSSIVLAPIRVGVQKDGTVSCINPEYWARAFIPADQYPSFAVTVAAVNARLHTALNTGQAFGGDVAAADLPHYRYMFGMERFADRSLIKEYPGFDQALRTVEENLEKKVGATSKVYEISFADAKIAVIGFAQNDADHGEGWWVNRIHGADHIAALPWEIFIVDGKIYGLYARYRTALAWPTLGMGQFMTIVRHPDATHRMIKDIAGAE